MTIQKTATRPSHTLAALASLLAFALAFPLCSRADDRDLLRTAAGRPYVFLLMDTSSSMGGAVGDLTLPYAGADSPESKLYQAKQALYQVIEEIDFVDFGFATFNQDSLRMQGKHWMYQAKTDGVALSGGGAYPLAGDHHVFGQTQDCYPPGCTLGDAAELDDSFEAGRVAMLGKLGQAGSGSTDIYVRDGNIRYQITFSPGGGAPSVSLGAAEIEVHIRVQTFAPNGSISSDQGQAVTFERVENLEAGFLAVDPGADTSVQSAGRRDKTFHAFEDAEATDTCRGWEGNDDSQADTYLGTNLKRVTTTASGSGVRSYGDLLPLSWESDNEMELLDLLAPNRHLESASAPGFVPDFRVAPFLQETPSGGLELLSTLESAGGTALVAHGQTSLGNGIHDFRAWFSSWRALAADGVNGDPDFGCRNVYLLLVTDGLETCNSNAGGQATALRQVSNIRTFVIGFGSDASSDEDVLDDIAVRGGTEAPFRPQTLDDLVTVFRNVLGEIQQAEVSFASAVAPTAQLNVADKVFFTDFVPLRNQSLWSGHVRAYLKPLPLLPDGRLDQDRHCQAGEEYGCLAWDSGEELVAQSPSQAELDTAFLAGGTNDPLGQAEDQRRIFYGSGIPSPGIPDSRSPFWADLDSPPATWANLLFGLGIPYLTPPLPATLLQAKTVQDSVLAIRELTTTIQNPDGTSTVEDLTYLLGDSFHSDPLIVDSPNDFAYFGLDYGTNNKACNDPATPNPGYRCFVERHLYRRKMLMIGGNDGQIHAFDAGVLREEAAGTIKRFDNGTGRELFSYIPRALLTTVKAISEADSHNWAADGGLLVRDVFIDPSHTGIPNPAQREWRTVAFQGLREGGRAVLALDVTQPDLLANGLDPANNDGVSDFANIPVPLSGATSHVPSCWQHTGGGACGTLPFPSMLWELTDTSDEDGNGLPDLGDTWSAPSIGLVRVKVGLEEEDRFVAVFGGGIDPNYQQPDVPGVPASSRHVVGNWIYMVDVETGDVLYKRRVSGAVPSAISAVDTDRDLYLDTLYFGTTAGLFYKADLSGPPPDIVTLRHPVTADDQATWQPFPIFDTGGREIFYPPAVVYTGADGRFALGFGTGYRENLWLLAGEPPGRYFMLLDDDFSSPMTPLTAADLVAVDAESSARTEDDHLLLSGGWALTLEVGERLVSNSFSVAGVTLFNTYRPDPPVTTTNNAGDLLCARTGISRVYVVSTLNANGYVPPPPGDGGAITDRDRYLQMVGFAASPFVEQVGTKNQPVDGNTTPPYATADELSQELETILQELKARFPSNCRFNGRNRAVRLRLHTGELRTPLVFPICIVPHDWQGP